MTQLNDIQFHTPAVAWSLGWSERKPIHLSQREREIAKMIGLGMRLTDMAVQLGVSVKTVVTYRMRLRNKLGCRDDIGVSRYAQVMLALDESA